MRMIIAIAALAAALPAQASWRKVSDAQAIRLWYAATDECRGGDHLPSDRVCALRDVIEMSLAQHGWCYADRDWRVPPTRYRWHRCEKAPG